MAYTIQPVDKSTEQEMLQYLLRYEDYTLFLLGNFTSQGNGLTDHPNSGNFKLIREANKIVGVFCLSRRGNLLIHSEVIEPIFHLVLEACAKEPIPIGGLIGNWELCHRLWNRMKMDQLISQETFISKEVLYSVDLAKISYPPEPAVRLLQPEDFPLSIALRIAYIKEMNIPIDMTEERLKEDYLWGVERKRKWGLFLEGELISIADFNAQALDLAQVGGVYTRPEFRGRGFSKAVMRQLMSDAK